MRKPRKRLPGLSGQPERWDDWPAWQRYNMAFAQEQMRKNGEIPGAVFLFHDRASVVPVLVGFLKDGAPKSLVYRFLSAIAIALESDAVGMIAEGWTKSVAQLPGESDAAYIARYRSGVLPSQSESRIEMVTCSLVYRDGLGELLVLTDMAETLRDAKGKISGFKPLLTDEERHQPVRNADGLLAGVLQAEPPSAHAAAKAREMLDTIGGIAMQHLNIRWVTQ